MNYLVEFNCLLRKHNIKGKNENQKTTITKTKQLGCYQQSQENGALDQNTT